MRTMIRPLTRWEPRNDLRGVNRLFDEFFSRPVYRDEETSMCGGWTPAVNILEKEEGLTITAELPGLSAKDVEVTVDNGVLTVRGERTLGEVSEGETWHRVESCYGAFERRFTVPTSVDTGKITATFSNGVMTLELPKREESKPKSIKIKVDSK